LSLVLTAASFAQTRMGHTPGAYPLPSVSAMGSHFRAYPLPSVSSGPNMGFGNRFHNGEGFGHGGRFHRRDGAFATPYYYVPYGYGYGYDYDYVGGPDMYSGSPDTYAGPPPTPNESTLHIIVEQPPVQSYGAPSDDPQITRPPRRSTVQEQPAPVRDVKPREPTVLVYRDGHKQEVGNYAIMGQTVYVLDEHTQKISLADLDVPATVKANDDRGMEFKIPVTQRPGQKKNSDLQPNGTPSQEPPPVANVASMLP
jgi:hypothetical protein